MTTTMRKVYFISVDTLRFEQTEPPSYVGNDFFYVVGSEGEEEAIEHLRTQIRKYYFKTKLSNKASEDPKRLGERIIVDGYVTEATADAPMDVIDFTSAAWLYAQDHKEHWVDWDITLEEANA